MVITARKGIFHKAIADNPLLLAFFLVIERELKNMSRKPGARRMNWASPSGVISPSPKVKISFQIAFDVPPVKTRSEPIIIVR